MAYKFEGEGCFEDFVKEVDRLLDCTDHCVVIQPKSMSGIASMRIRNGKWEIELGS